MSKDVFSAITPTSLELWRLFSHNLRQTFQNIPRIGISSCTAGIFTVVPEEARFEVEDSNLPFVSQGQTFVTKSDTYDLAVQILNFRVITPESIRCDSGYLERHHYTFMQGVH